LLLFIKEKKDEIKSLSPFFVIPDHVLNLFQDQFRVGNDTLGRAEIERYTPILIRRDFWRL